MLPHPDGIGVHAFHRAVGAVLRIEYENRVLPVEFSVVVIGEVAASADFRAAEGIVPEQQLEQNDGHRESVRVNVGPGCADDDFRGHIPLLPGDAEIEAVRSNVVAVADEYVTR